MRQVQDHPLRWALIFSLVAVSPLAAQKPAGSPLPPGEGIVLPIQDRVGSPDTLVFLDLLVRQEISQAGPLASVVDLRDTLRQLRMREVTTSSPDKLKKLAESVNADWFLSTTLHEMVRGPIVQVTLSAQVFRPDQLTLDWVGFVSLTGIDQQTWLGIGKVNSLEDLLRRAVPLLFRSLISPSPPVNRSARPRGATNGYLRQPVPPQESAIVAVIPFFSVTDRNPLLVAELQTRASLAALHHAGHKVALPGAVHEIMREQGQLFLGELDYTMSRELEARLAAKWIFTGTVETYRVGTGLRPDPWVAIGARIVESRTGQIFWIHGLERQGSDTDFLFERGRIYSAANLAMGITQRLISGFSDPKQKNRGKI